MQSIPACSGLFKGNGSKIEAILIMFVLVLGTASVMVGIEQMRNAFADSNQAAVAYASSLLSSRVKYKEWIPSTESWSSEVALQDTGSQVVDAKLLFSPNNSLRAILSASENGDLNLFTCSNSCTDSASWTHVEGSSIANTGVLSLLALNPKRPYDMAFEQTSGNLVITYDKGIKLSNSFFYRVFSGVSETLGAESSYQYAGGLLANPVNYLSMSSDVVSDEITMIFYDPVALHSYAVIWDSASEAWGNQITVSSSLSAANIIGESVGVAYETDTGASVVFSGDGLNSAAYARWTSSGWSSVSTTDPEQATLLNEVTFVSVKADPSSNSSKLMICQAGLSLTCAHLDSGVLGAWNDPGPQPVSLLSRPFDFAWDPSGSTGVLLSEAGLSNDYQYAIWTGSSWTAGSTISADISHAWIMGSTNPYESDSVNAIFIGSNALNELDYLTYDGSTLALTSGGLSVTQIGSVLYEGADLHFSQDLSSIPQAYTATLTESVLVTDQLSRSLAAQNVLSDSLTINSNVLVMRGTGGAGLESIFIADSIAVVKTPANGATGSGSSESGGGSDGSRRLHDSIPPTVSAAPPEGSYSSSQTIILSADEPSTIYYTTDGSDPTLSSNIYSAPIMITQDTTLKFLAKDTAGNSGAIVTMTYLIRTTGADSISNTVEPAGQNEQSNSDINDAVGNPENDRPNAQGNSDDISQSVPASTESRSGILVDERDSQNAWNIGMIIAAVLVPAALLPSALLHTSRKKDMFIDGVLIDGGSIGKLFGKNNENLFGYLLDLKYKVCWITGLMPKDVRIVLDSGTAVSLGLIGMNHGSSKERKLKMLSTSDGTMHNYPKSSTLPRSIAGIIISKENELTLEVIRNELEQRILMDEEKWFILTADRNYRYGKDKLDQLLFDMPEDGYRNHRRYALLETITHLEYILDYFGNPRFLVAPDGRLLFHDRNIRGLQFSSRYGKGRTVPRDKWIENELLRLGTKVTEEGSKLMSYQEKHELLIAVAIENYLSADSYQDRQVWDEGKME